MNVRHYNLILFHGVIVIFAQYVKTVSFNSLEKVILNLIEMCDSEKFVKIMGSDTKQLHSYIEKAWNIRKDHLYTM